MPPCALWRKKGAAKERVMLQWWEQIPELGKGWEGTVWRRRHGSRMAVFHKVLSPLKLPPGPSPVLCVSNWVG